MTRTIVWTHQALRRFRLSGLLVASVFGLFGAPCATRAANLVVNPSFESGSPSIGLRPTTFGVWRGDVVSYVTSQNAITPPAGSRMLRFLDTSTASPGAGNTSQYYQNINLSAFHDEIAAGQAKLSASALFNRIAGDLETDDEFDLEFSIRSGTPTSFTELDFIYSTLHSDDDPNTWELSSIDNYLLPVATDYVQLIVTAHENVHDDTTNPELDGHYADNVNVTVAVPEPASAVSATIGAGLALLGVWARRRRSAVS